MGEINKKGKLTYLLQFGIACFLTSYLTIVAAYYQFGLKCCERHLTFRQCLIYIGLISIAAFFAGRVKDNEKYKDVSNENVVTLLLLISVLLPTSVSFGDIIHTYENYNKYISVNNDNWNNGVSKKEYFIYCLLPSDKIIGGIYVADGKYDVNDASGWFVHSILDFFDKKSILFKNDVSCVR